MKRTVLFGMGLCMVLPLLAILAFVAVLEIRFARDVEGHLKRAADSNTIATAYAELHAATAYLKERGFTEGYTSVIYKTPDEDVGFWYGNLVAAEKELAQMQGRAESVSPLEQSNVLMKLRETLMDTGKSGESITAPPGISRLGFNTTFAVCGVVFLVAAGVGLLAMFVAVED